MLTEHYAGNFPLWLSPVQVVLIRSPSGTTSMLARCWRGCGRRAARAPGRPGREDGRKIRDAETAKVPYMLVVGDKEAANGQVSVRNRFQGDEGADTLDDFLARIKGFVDGRTVRP